jgi:hypothetical protein
VSCAAAGRREARDSADHSAVLYKTCSTFIANQRTFLAETESCVAINLNSPRRDN